MALVDVALDDSLDLPAGGTYFLTGAPLVMQRIRMRLSRFLGEELLDTSLGLPFIEWRATKPVPTAEIVALVRREVETIPGVARTRDWLGTFTPSTRTVTVTGTAILDSGDEVAVTALPLGGSERVNRSAPLILLQRV